MEYEYHWEGAVWLAASGEQRERRLDVDGGHGIWERGPQRCSLVQ